MEKQAQKLIRQLKTSKLTLALAESITCGLVAHRLSGCIGTSEVLKGSIVCYTPEVKMSVMHVPKKLIDRCTCESKEVTELLAKNLSKIIKADICAAITGLASPGGTETKEKPVGTVFFSVYYKNKIYNHRQIFRGTPLEIKKKAADAMYKFIISKSAL